MVVPDIKEIENTDANALACTIIDKLSSAHCKKVYRGNIGLSRFGLENSITIFQLLIYLLQHNATEEEYEIYNCYYQNRY